MNEQCIYCPRSFQTTMYILILCEILTVSVLLNWLLYLCSYIPKCEDMNKSENSNCYDVHSIIYCQLYT